MDEVHSARRVIAPCSTFRASVAALCRSDGIRAFALFGSATRDGFRSGSDVDVLVEFGAEAHPTLCALVRLPKELEGVFAGRPVDVVMKNSVSPYLADRILREPAVIDGG
jgi:predicted nucleotidyltransferase